MLEQIPLLSSSRTLFHGEKNLTALRLKRGPEKSHFSLQLWLYESWDTRGFTGTGKTSGWGAKWWIGIWSYCYSLLFSKENVLVWSNQSTLTIQFFLLYTVLATTKPWSELLPLILIWYYATLRPAENATLRCCAALPRNSGKDTEKKQAAKWNASSKVRDCSER